MCVCACYLVQISSPFRRIFWILLIRICNVRFLSCPASLAPLTNNRESWRLTPANTVSFPRNRVTTGPLLQYLPPGKFGGGSRIDFYVFRFQLRIIYLDNLKLLRETCKAFFRRKLGNAESEGWNDI